MNWTIALSLSAIAIGLANIICMAVFLWEDRWNWRYRNWRADRYVRSRQRHGG